MSENTKIKIKYRDFLQLENYQKSLINFIMKDAYVSCDGIYQGTKASYYFYESENHWMRITAKQPGEACNSWKIGFAKTARDNGRYVLIIRVYFNNNDYTVFFYNNVPDIITPDMINSRENVSYKLIDLITFDGKLDIEFVKNLPSASDHYYCVPLSGGSDTPVLQEYFMYAQMPSSDIETYNESIGHYLYHGEYIASDLSYKFGVKAKRDIAGNATLFFKRGSNSEVNTLYISLQTSTESSPSELAHKAFESGKETLVPSDLNDISVGFGIMLGDLFKFTGSIPWNDIPHGDASDYIRIYLYTGEYAHGQYPATGTPTLYAHSAMLPNASSYANRFAIKQNSMSGMADFTIYYSTGYKTGFIDYGSSTTISASTINSSSDDRHGYYVSDYIKFYGEINVSDLPAYNEDPLEIVLSGGQDTTINNNAYGTFEMNSPYFDLMAGDDSTKLIEYDSNLYYYLDSDNMEQFDFGDGEVLQTKFVPYIGRNISTDDKRIPTQLSAENRHFTLSLLQKDVYKYDLPLRTSTFRIVTSSNETYDLYYKFNFVPLYEQYDYSTIMEAFKDNGFYFIYGFETLSDNYVQLAMAMANYNGAPLSTFLFKKFTNDITNKVYTNNINRISFPLLVHIDTPLSLAVVFAELYSETDVCSINFDNIEIDHIEIYKDNMWKIAKRSSNNSDNFAVLNILEDDNTGIIVPSTYFPDNISQE